jgi:outer membrane cobalamin receptor
MKLNAFRREWFRVVIGVYCTFTAGIIHASETDSVSSSMHHLKRVTVSAERSSRIHSASMPTQVMTSETMRGWGVQNLADAARRLPGITVKDYGGIGGLKTVSIRGLGAEHTAVVYDGVAVSNCQAGQIDIGRFNMDDVETLSLSVGQQNDLMQSARLYASAGVLSLKTKNPLEGTPLPYVGKVQLRGGSFGLLNPSFSWAQRVGERTTYQLSGNFVHSLGEYPFTLVNGEHVTQERRQNSDVLSWNVEGNLYHCFTDGSRLTAKVHYYDSERGLPGSVILYNNLSDERLWDKNAFAQVRYQKTFTEKWRLQVEGKYNYSWTKYEDTDVKYVGGKKTDINEQQEYYLSASALWTPIEGVYVSWANDGFFNLLENNFPNNPQPQRWTWLSALNLRWNWKRLTLNGTLVSTFAAEQVSDGVAPNNRKHLSPSFSFVYQPFHAHSFFLRLMYKDTFRNPSFNDMYYEQTGNRGLRPEKAHEYNVGVTWKSKSWNSLEYLSLTADAYYNKVEDKIVALPSLYVWRMMNYGRVDIKGADISVQGRFIFDERFRLSLTAVYSFQEALDLTDKKSKTYKHQVPYTPRHSGNVGAQLETPWLNVGYSVVLVGERYRMRQNTPANLLERYDEHTLTLSRAFQLKRCELRLQVDVVNLTDKQYDVIKYYPMPGRSNRCTIQVKF